MANNNEPRRNVDRTSGASHSGGFSTASSGYSESRGKSHTYRGERSYNDSQSYERRDYGERRAQRSSSDGRQARNQYGSTGRNSSGRAGSSRNISSDRYDRYERYENADTSPARSGKKKKSNKPKTKAQRAWGMVGKIALSVFLIGVIAAFLVVGAFGIYMFCFVDDTIPQNLNDLTVNQKSIIYVRDSEDDSKWVPYQELYRENREWVDLEKMSPYLPNAFIAAEDKRFKTHHGVDWKRTIAATINTVVPFLGSTQGGSTIDQQLVKNLTKDDDVSPMRKIREIMRARKIDATYSKEVIIECYLNYIYLNNNCYGVQAAAKFYFGKTTAELNIQECASLAAITKEPAAYDPITHLDDHVSRRNWVINEMFDLGEITEAERDEAVKSDVVLGGKAAKLAAGQSVSEDDDEKTDKSKEEDKSNIFSYFTDTLIDQLVDDLVEQTGCSEEGAEELIYTGGLKIYATLDSKVQSVVDKVFTTDTYWSKVYRIKDKPNGAMTIMDYSGHVVAICGGRGEKTVSRGLNHATAAHQPGSCMKPVGVYAPALEDNLITWSTLISNSALTYNGDRLKNYDGSTSAPVTVQNALERSLNLVPARILIDYGESKSYDFATQKFHMSTLVESDKNVSGMALGGSTYGVTTVDMSAAYATFGNGGYYYKPTLYELVLNSRETLDNYKEPVLKYSGDGEQVLGEDTAYIMNQLLRTVVTGSRGTGGSAGLGGWQVIAKTGTTSNNKGRYFVGGTPYYISAVWFGCDPPVAMNSISSGTNPALRLWRGVFKQIHSDLSKKSFTKSNDVKTAKYCVHSGLIASSKCNDTTRIGYYKKSYAPVCTGKHIVTGDEGTSSGASSGTSSGASSGATSGTSSGASSGTTSGTSSGTSSGGTSSGSTATSSSATSSRKPLFPHF